METITDNEVLAIMMIAVGFFIICCFAIGALVWYSHHNRTDFPEPSQDMIDHYDEIHDKRKLD